MQTYKLNLIFPPYKTVIEYKLSISSFLGFLFFFFFAMLHTTQDLYSQLGIELVHPALEVWSLSH